MRTEKIELSGFTIYEAPNLDPVMVIIQDVKPGHGRLIVECYGEIWTTYWGGIGNRTLRDFLLSCSADYIRDNLLPSRKRATKRDEAYLMRIVSAVQEAIENHELCQ